MIFFSFIIYEVGVSHVYMSVSRVFVLFLNEV